MSVLIFKTPDNEKQFNRLLTQLARFKMRVVALQTVLANGPLIGNYEHFEELFDKLSVVVEYIDADRKRYLGIEDNKKLCNDKK